LARTRRHVSLIESTSENFHSFALLGPTGAELPSFAAFAKTLRSSPFNTRTKYCSSVADFFDFYFEAVLHLTVESESVLLTKEQLVSIITAWPSYLTDGESSGDSLAAEVAKTLPSPRVLGSTAANKQVALSRFLRRSERLRRQSEEFSTLGLLTLKVDYEPLLKELGQLRAIGISERFQILRTSMLGSLTSSQSTREMALTANVVENFDRNRAFPLNRFEEFVDALPSYRDKSLYCLYAASGCRSHEGLQLLWSDVDIINGEIKLISPFVRPNHSSYAALTPLERDLLAWKGRETNDTFLIEPYLSMFFENLEHYHREEYYPHGRHQFVFQIAKRPSRGKPYFLTDTSTRQEVFDTAAKKIGLDKAAAGPHSLRHAYGTYLLNYMPLQNGGYGLPIGSVRVAMAHASVKSTEKYALLDKDLLSAQVQFANLQVFHQGNVRGQLDFKIEALARQITKLKGLQKDISNG